MLSTPLLRGLFDRPINTTMQTTGVTAKVDAPVCFYGSDPFCNQDGFCAPGYYLGVGGFCVPYEGDTLLDGSPTDGSTSSSSGSTTDAGNVTVNVQNTVNVPASQIQALTDAITQGIQQTSASVQDMLNASGKTIVGEIQEDTDSIQSGISAAATNLGNEVTVTTAAIGGAAAATGAAISAGANSLLDSIKSTVSSALGSISSVIDSINTEVQKINDTFIQPLITFYNSTVGTIATLTTAIESDLKNGITGLLQLPGQVATELAGFDSTLDRTVQQLGAQNLQTVTSGIDYEGQVLPDKYSASFQAGLGGKTSPDTLKTTFTGQVNLSGETLAQASQEAISGLGTLLNQVISTVFSTFKSSIDTAHADWAGLESVFTGLLDGALTLITTVTSMGSLAAPLIQAAEQQANVLVPTAKLDPATVIEAMRRKILNTSDGLSELSTYGFDTTRQQVLQDLSVFLADANQAIDWWYRGIISDDDLASNLNEHGMEPADQTALKEGSNYLPDVTTLIRWLNFGIITQDQLTPNLRALRYTDSQIQALLASYQTRESPQTLAQLDGLLSVSTSGWLSSVFSSSIPDSVQTAAQRANIHPDLLRYIWLSHYQIPEVQTFIQLYFRGIRTLTEVQQRMQAANIPPELWDDMIQVNRALIPYRSIPTYVKSGLMTQEQAQTELASHGFDLAHQQIILSSLKPPATPTNQTAANSIKAISQANAKELWEIGAFTDDQYEQTLIAHGYTTDTAALQVQADKVTEHVKQQKQMLADLMAEVETGATTIDAATQLLNQNGFTPGQISQFALKINKAQKVNAKIPSIAEMLKFVKESLITVDQFSQALQSLGWQDPWFTAYVTLAQQNVVPVTDTGATS